MPKRALEKKPRKGESEDAPSFSAGMFEPKAGGAEKKQKKQELKPTSEEVVAKPPKAKKTKQVKSTNQTPFEDDKKGKGSQKKAAPKLAVAADEGSDDEALREETKAFMAAFNYDTSSDISEPEGLDDINDE